MSILRAPPQRSRWYWPMFIVGFDRNRTGGKIIKSSVATRPSNTAATISRRIASVKDRYCLDSFQQPMTMYHQRLWHSTRIYFFPFLCQVHLSVTVDIDDRVMNVGWKVSWKVWECHFRWQLLMILAPGKELHGTTNKWVTLLMVFK